MSRAETSRDVHWCQRSPSDWGHSRRVASRSNPFPAERGPPASPSALACRQGERSSLLSWFRYSWALPRFLVGLLIVSYQHGACQRALVLRTGGEGASEG